MMKYLNTVVLFLLVLGGCGSRQIVVPEEAVVLVNGRVIDGSGRSPIPDGIVVIKGARIHAVGVRGDFLIPEGVRVIDARGGSILPGIINSHTHSPADAEGRREFLLEGVTTVGNVGQRLDQLDEFEPESTNDGPSARAYWAGPIITAPGGYPGPVYGFEYCWEVATASEGRDAVADLLDRGASMIKIALAPGDPRNPWPVLDLERVQAIVDEAHAGGVLVRAHVFEPYLVEDIVLPAGVDAIEHMPFPILTEEEETSVLEAADPCTQLFEVAATEYDSLLQRLVEQDVVIVPTLDQLVGRLYEKPEKTAVEQIVIDVHLETVRRFHALGGRVALGNDYANVGIEAGMPIMEMTLLVEAGLTPLSVIEASTREAAVVCGQRKTLGTLEPGKLADVIVVAGDPLQDIQAMREVVVVIKGGELAYSKD
ncbi:MAG: amidohydrolase family protein [Fidelibacterota bacterium]|nr:MAG: amidohydrolase family protein [Candidatus Neomarinimicrobiota bacterium]